jgi:hypothetical protein
MRPKKGEREEQGNQGERTGDQSRGDKDAEAIGEVVDGLEQKLIDQPIPDLLGHLVILIHRTDEKL